MKIVKYIITTSLLVACLNFVGCSTKGGTGLHAASAIAPSTDDVSTQHSNN